MTRRIGFGEGEKREKERRADAARRRAATERPQAPAPAREKDGMSAVGRLLLGLFLTVWLIGWSAGIYFAASAMFGGDGPAFFLAIWLAFAIFGWIIAVRFLFRIVAGQPINPKKRSGGPTSRI